LKSFIKTEKQSVLGIHLLFLLKVFGAFVSDYWRPNRGFYGAGESFLFTLYPEWNLYQWTGINDYIMYSTENEIALGGGGGFVFIVAWFCLFFSRMMCLITRSQSTLTFVDVEGHSVCGLILSFCMEVVNIVRHL
jgi:uncharacterized membrane protein